jgi:hypothetical protein
MQKSGGPSMLFEGGWLCDGLIAEQGFSVLVVINPGGRDAEATAVRVSWPPAPAPRRLSRGATPHYP